MSGYTYKGTQRLDPDPVIPRTGPKGGRPCGTPDGYQRHLEAHEKACNDCRKAHTDAERARRRAKGIPERTKADCGTVAGHNRHRALREQPCDPCRLVWNKRERERMANNPEARARRAAYLREYRAYMKARKDAA